MNEFALINGKIVSPEEIFEGTVFVKDGKISEISRKKNEDLKIPVVDLNGKYLLPGLIDIHVHFRTPGMTQKEDWVSGSKAALAGGVTTVLDMPNTIPATTNQDLLDQKRRLVEKDSLINYGFYLGATEENLEQVKNISNIAGVKIYMGSSTGNLLIKDEQVLEKFIAESGKLLAIHAEKEECIREGQLKYEHQQNPSIHSQIRSPECAFEAVETVLRLVQKYPKAQVHFCHVTTAKELELIKKWKTDNKELQDQVSVEVTPHHLFLNETDYETYGNIIKVNPPLRNAEDQQALWQGIQDGIVDVVATDHAPHLMEEKMLPYAKVPSGVPGVQTMLPLLLHAVNERKITLQKLVELISFRPAAIFGMKRKGAIQKDFDADFTVVDLEMVEKVCHHYLWTKTDWSPFHGWYLKGWPVMTFVAGELMYEWRETFGKNSGKEITFIDKK